MGTATMSNATGGNATGMGPPEDPVVFFGEPVIAVAVVTIVLSSLFIGMRFWSRGVILGIFALEDWFLLLGWIFSLATSVCMLVQLRFGLGRRFATLALPVMVNYLKTALATNIIYVCALVFVKVSILCLYFRALKHERIRLAVKILLVVVAISHAWIIVSVFTTCIPLDASWDFSKRPTAYCHPFSVYWSHAGINIATDFLIFALPLTVLHKLRVPRGQKIALYLVFLLAFSVCIISVVRTLQFLDGITMGDRDTVVISCWTMLEVHIAVVCACMTTIKPLLARLFPGLFTLPGAGTDAGVETIGRARQRRHTPLDSDVATVTDKEPGQSSSNTETGRGDFDS